MSTEKQCMEKKQKIIAILVVFIMKMQCMAAQFLRSVTTTFFFSNLKFGVSITDI